MKITFALLFLLGINVCVGCSVMENEENKPECSTNTGETRHLKKKKSCNRTNVATKSKILRLESDELRQKISNYGSCSSEVINEKSQDNSNDVHQLFVDGSLQRKFNEGFATSDNYNTFRKYEVLFPDDNEDDEDDEDYSNADNIALRNVGLTSNSILESFSVENNTISGDSEFVDGARSSYLDLNNVLMFPQSNLHVNDVIEMVSGFCIQIGIVERARTKLMDIIKILAGPQFKNLNISNYTFNKILNPPEDKITYHYYCQSCEKKIVHSSAKSAIKKQDKICENCEMKNTISLGNPKYFLSIDLEYQLHLLLKDKTIRECFLKKITNNIQNHGNDNITDIQDSLLYRETAKKFPLTITYNISTDGAPLSDGRNSNRSFWPLSVVFNDLPPEIRYNHVLLVGVLIVSHEPHPDLMNLFIDTFKRQAILLHTEGFRFTFPEDKITRNLTFTTLCIIADSCARALLQYRLKYNGYCSCSYCYQLGFYCNIVKFPFIGSKCEQRTHQSHMNDVTKVETERIIANGVKGRASFCDFPNVDMVRSFALDSMHNGVLGCTEQISECIRSMLKKDQRDKLDVLLMKIQPPRELHRVPSKLSKKSGWKATHWKAWMLYYSVVIFSEVIELKHVKLLKHYMLFVNAMYILSKTDISPADLKKCKNYLLTFVAHAQVHYGICEMTFNIHLLIHAVQNVIDSGPTWSTSAYPFESNIFILKRSANSPKGAEQQMANKSLQRLQYKFRPRDHLPEDVRDMCDSFMTEKRFTASVKSSQNVKFFCQYKSDDCPPQCETFLRCIYDNKVLTTVRYVRNNSFNDSVVKLRNESIVQILDICLRQDGCVFLNVQPLILEQFHVEDAKIEHIWRVLLTTPSCITVNISEVHSKMVVLDLEKNQYVCSMPNCFEKQ